MTDDITNDLALLDDWLAGKGYGEEAGLAMRAMDLFRKQADEFEKLRAALKPFADAASFFLDDDDADWLIDSDITITIGALRAARAAMEWKDGL